jgi:hypothetical protein
MTGVLLKCFTTDLIKLIKSLIQHANLVNRSLIQIWMFRSFGHHQFSLSAPKHIRVLYFAVYYITDDRLCGLVVRVPSYRSRGPGLDSRRYQILWKVVDLERGPLSLVRIIEEIFERTVAAAVSKTEINGHGDSLLSPRYTLYPPTSGGRSVGIVRWRTKPSSFLLYHWF